MEWMNEWINKITTGVTSKARIEMEIGKEYEGIFWGNGNVLNFVKSWGYTDVCICQNSPIIYLRFMQNLYKFYLKK